MKVSDLQAWTHLYIYIYTGLPAARYARETLPPHPPRALRSFGGATFGVSVSVEWRND